MNVLKMTSPEDASSSLVLSFGAQSEDSLRNGEVSVVFRKRGPRKETPDFLYVYVGAPVSAIIGRLPVIKFKRQTVAKALLLAEEGKISRDELREYAKACIELCVFRVSPFESAVQPIEFQELSSRFGFVAPQNFFILSNKGKGIIDHIAGFDKSRR